MRRRAVKGRIIAFVIVALWGTIAEGITIKRYEPFSGKIIYKIYMRGEMDGAIREIKGSKKRIFDQYGMRELEDEHTTLKISLVGHEQHHKVHSLTLRDGNDLKVVDFQKKQILHTTLPYMALVIQIAQNNMTRGNEAMMRRAGGKKVGTKVIAGYRCDKWEFPGTEMCVYRGIPLEIEREIGGIVRHEEATFAQLDVPISSDEYTLPDFPVVEMPSDKAPITEVMEAVSPVKRFNPIKSHQPEMSASDEAVYTSIRQQSLRRIASMKRLYKCLKQSDDLKQSNECGKKYAEEIGEAYVPGELWNSSVRAMVLLSLERALQIGQCLKEAKNLKELVECEKSPTQQHP